MSFRADRNELHLGEIVARALRRRLYPNSLLRPKQLAYDLRISERTIWNLMSGNRPPAGETLWTLCNFFGADMVGEIFGCTIQRPRPHHHRRRAVFRVEGAVSKHLVTLAMTACLLAGCDPLGDKEYRVVCDQQGYREVQFLPGYSKTTTTNGVATVTVIPDRKIMEPTCLREHIEFREMSGDGEWKRP